MANPEPAPATPAQPAAAPAPKKKVDLGWMFSPLPEGSFQHAALWSEKSGGTLAVIGLVLNFAISLHSIQDWGPWQWIPMGAFLVMVAAWYPSAQANGVEIATRNQGVIDPRQANRDFGWSLLPLIPVGISAILTVVAWALMLFGTHLFDDPHSWVIRDRMVMAPAMAFFNLVVVWMVKVDLGNNNNILSEMAQIAGRLTRFEQATPNH